MIYISTGGFNKFPAYEIAKKLVDYGFQNIELSGGKYYPDQLNELKKFKAVNFLIHNYFPPPEKPFVLNLATESEEILNLTYAHIYDSLNYCYELKCPIYSFHAGFFSNLNVEDLGNGISSNKLFDRNDSLKKFIERVNIVDKRAKSLGISLLIENNILTKNNYQKFNSNPFMMTDYSECEFVMNNTSDNVNMLMDVGHLKVSSATLGFDFKNFFTKCGKWIKAYHLSDNESISDDNKSIAEGSWFWNFIDKKVKYLTLEVYENNFQLLYDQTKLIERRLNED